MKLNVQNKRREENLVALLQQRDEEWKEELAQGDRALRAELREGEKAFMTDQLKRDHEVIKVMEIREKDMELNLLQKVEAFGYLYKEH